MNKTNIENAERHLEDLRQKYKTLSDSHYAGLNLEEATTAEKYLQDSIKSAEQIVEHWKIEQRNYEKQLKIDIEGSFIYSRGE